MMCKRKKEEYIVGKGNSLVTLIHVRYGVHHIPCGIGLGAHFCEVFVCF